MRKGKDGTTIDDLTYDYGAGTSFHSNKLRKVTDAANDTKGFTEFNASGDDYVYDNNGSLLWDRNKGGQELLKNGEFTSGSTDWTVTDIGSRLTFANDRVEIVSGSASSTLQQNNLLKAWSDYIVIIDMERTSGTANLTLTAGGTAVTVSNTGLSTFDMRTTSTKDFVVTIPAAFVGRINSIQVKGLMTISYNFLNLTERASRSSDQTINYIYDASGRKLCQMLSSNNAPVKKTDYAGEYFYTNDTLKFVNHEEGRVVMTDEPVYEYHLKDHLGNVRLTFTTKNEVDEGTATMEDANAASEASKFLYYTEAVKVNTTLFDHTNAGGTYYSTRLNGSANEQTGLAKSLSVMPGDTVRAEVYAKYLDTNSANWSSALNDLITAIANGTAPAGTLIDGGAVGSTGGITPPWLSLLNKSNETGAAPKAYLNYLIFDRDYNLLNGGFVRMTDAAREYGQDGAHEKLAAEFVIIEPGYVYIYLSNDNTALGGAQVETFWDDLQVTQVKSSLVSMRDFYPYGMAFGEYDRESSLKNRYLFNQGTGEKIFLTERVYDLGLNVDQSKYRTYDYNTGRWWQIDPLADEPDFTSLTPYNYSFNNPVRYNDPYGDCPRCPPPAFAPAIPIIVEGGAALLEGLAVAGVGATIATFGEDIWDAFRSAGGGNPDVLRNPAAGSYARWEMSSSKQNNGGSNQSREQSPPSQSNAANNQQQGDGKNNGTFGGKKDTEGKTRNQALNNAKEQNAIPKSQQPDKTIKPNTPEGSAAGLDKRNVVQHEYTNSQGQKVIIRLDKPANYPDGGSQQPHWNAGEAYKQKLDQHHNYGGN